MTAKPCPHSASETLPHLFGFDSTPAVVAVEIVGPEAVLIRADGPDGSQRTTEHRPFWPWLLTTAEAPDSLGSASAAAIWTHLEGTGFQYLVEFPTWDAFQTAREALRATGTPHHAYGTPVKQFLVRSGITLFKGLDFSGIRRLQLDLETTTLQPTDPQARILMIAAGDNQGHAWVLAGEERDLLLQLTDLFRTADPDVIEGHNLFGFDVPYLLARYAAHGLVPAFGRDGSALAAGRERKVPLGGLSRPFTPAHIWGRHVLDTLFAVQRFDVARGELESHGLKEVARHYGLASPERVYLDRARLEQTWREDPERVRRYAIQDIEETRRLAELVLPTEFYQTQMVPDSYQNVATGGSGEKINSLLIREYLHRGHAIPQPQPPTALPGGYTEIRETGVLRRVVKADVESLYPSLMLHYGIRPESDTLNVFLPMLAELTQRRLEAKAKAREDGPDAAYWDGLQSSFKILINSFYGYLGAPPFHFNDHRAAAQVTTTGQQIVKQVAEELERSGSQVIEIDTDGVYFVPPPDVLSEAQEREYVERIGSALPEGIRLAYDGRFAAMVSLKIKNYVLVTYDGRKIARGASLRSRADEPFGREFLSRAVDYLIAGDLPALAADYQELARKITQGEWAPEQFCRRERVTEKTFRSAAKRRSREAARDAGIGEMLSLYQRADGSLGREEEYAGDEDRFHYLEKLYKFAARLSEAVGPDFERLCPKPMRKRFVSESAGQQSLFDDW